MLSFSLYLVFLQVFVVIGDNRVEVNRNIEKKNYPLWNASPTLQKYELVKNVAVSLSTTEQTVPIGNSLTVTCSGNSSDIWWKNRWNQKITKSSFDHPYVKETFTGSLNISILVFDNVQQQDQGVYTCDNSKYKNELKNFSLHTYLNPSVEISPSSSIDFEEGDNFNFTCKGNSLNITWKNPYNQIVSSYASSSSAVYAVTNLKTNSSILVFKNASTWMNGLYTCSVNASGRETSKQIRTSINPIKLYFTSNDVISIKEDKDFEITCEGSVLSMTWLHKGKEVSKRSEDDIYMKDVVVKGRKISRKLKFDNLEISNSGEYVCYAVSSFNNFAIHRSFQLNVLEDNSVSIPKFSSNPSIISNSVTLLTNETFHVNCKGETKDIEWLGPPYNWKIPEDLSSSNSAIDAKRISKKTVALFFNDISLNVIGTYKCRVKKRNYYAENYFNLNVILPTFFNETQGRYEVKERENVTLACIVGGYPKPIVTWYHSNRSSIVINDVGRFKYHGDNLTITNVTYGDAGKYICEAIQFVNRGIRGERAIDLEVFHKPYFRKNEIFVEAVVNSTTVLKCNSIANPPARYSWSKNKMYVFTQSKIGVFDLPDNTLEIFVTKINNGFGDYVCNASNIYGFNTQIFHVIEMTLPLTPEINNLRSDKNNIYFTLKKINTSSIIYFNIEYKENSTKKWTTQNQTKGMTWYAEYQLNNLKEKTLYELKIRSVNAVGASNFSTVYNFSTTSLAVQLSSSSLEALLFVTTFLYIFNFYKTITH